MTSEVPKQTRGKATVLGGSNASLDTNLPESKASNASPDRNRFGGGKSYNMFFIRHTAQPRNLRLFTGNNNIQLCNMKENNYNLPDAVKDQIKSDTLASFGMPPPKKPVETISDPKYSLKMDDNLIKKYEDRFIAKRRKERILPPIKLHTCTFTLADDTLKWREELNSLGKMLGILTEEEIKSTEDDQFKPTDNSYEGKIDQLEKYEKELAKSNALMNLHLMNSSRSNHATAKMTKMGSQDGNSSRSKTGRFNEAKSQAAYSRKASRRGTGQKNKFILCTEDAEREMWLLQILCQVLKTESLQEIQSWLCSSNYQEKSAMKELIQKAMEGLKQADRISDKDDSETKDIVDFDHISSSITTFMDNQRNVQFSVLSQHSLINNKSDSNFNSESTTTLNSNGTHTSSVNPNLFDKEPKTPKRRQRQKEKRFIRDNDENFNSVSLMNMDSNYGSGYGTASAKIKKPHVEKKEISDKLDNFESFLSKSTYFQPKCKAINDHLMPYTRPFTSNDNRNFSDRQLSNEEMREHAIKLTLQPIDKDLINRFQRVKMVDPMPKLPEENAEPNGRKYLTLASMEYEDNKLLNNPYQFNVYEK